MRTCAHNRFRNAARLTSRYRARLLLSDQGGFSIIEAIIAGMVIVTGAIGVFGALQASGRTSADQRHRSESYVIAQQDQVRLRGLKISELANLNQTRTVSQGGQTFTIVSTGQFVTDETGTVSCDAESASADYINITSTVSWPNPSNTPATVVSSLIAPPNGSIALDRGSLAVAVSNGQEAPIPNILLSGSGPGAFSGKTGANGCALFGNLPEGTYTMTAGAGAGVVDRDGKVPAPQTVSVVGQSTNTVALLFDVPGSVDVNFRTRVGSTVLPSTADSVVAFNTGMSDARAFGTIGTRVSHINATPLFPFASPDTIYAGSCTANNPNPTDIDDPPNSEGIANVVVTPGGSATAQIQLPALTLNVSGNNSTAGAPVNNATVKITDRDCDDVNGNPIKRTLTTNAAGQLPDPGLPYGSYDICASNGTRRNTLTNVAVKSTDTNTVRTIFLGASASGIQSGTCP